VDRGVDNALWAKAVDGDEVINRLWTRLWITFESTWRGNEAESGGK
jgi:hypothetical protein